MATTVITVLVLYFLLVLGIGYYSTKKVQTADDYFIAGRKLNYYVTALSHQASALSGWLFLAWSGFVSRMGIGAVWTAIASGGAPITNFLILARRMRKYTEMVKARSIVDLLESRYYDEKTKIIRTVSVIIIFVCMCVYVAAQVMAAGKAFQVVLGWDYQQAAILGAVIVIAYTSAGGLLAVAWSDTFQGILMIIAVAFGLVLSLYHNAGWGNIVNALGSIKPQLITPWINPITIIGLLSAGYLGYLGQPQLLQMFMSMKNAKDAKRGAAIAGGVGIFLLFGSFVALLGTTALFPEAADPDTNFLQLFLKYSPGLLTGLILAAVMSAIMSSADSLLHVANVSVVEDFYNRIIKKGQAGDRQMLLVGRISAVLLGAVAVYIALNPFESIFWVLFWAWGGLTAFGPVILLGLYWKRANRIGAIAGLICGFSASVIWFQTGLYTKLHMSFPAFFVALIVTVAVSLLTAAPPKEIQDQVEALADYNMPETINVKTA